MNPQQYSDSASIGAQAAPTFEASARADFIIKTYQHLFGAIVLFTGIEVYLFRSGLAGTIAATMMSVNWLLILGAFMIASWLATHAAHTAESMPAQYAALGGFVLAQALIMVPMLYIADQHAPGAIRSAATVTLAGFTGLTFVAFSTRKDFTFLGGMLRWIGVVSIVAIIGAVLFGFHLGTWFSVAMIAFAGAAVLYDTSNVIRHYPEGRHVAASLSLFASIAMMLWYVLRLFMDRD